MCHNCDKYLHTAFLDVEIEAFSRQRPMGRRTQGWHGRVLYGTWKRKGKPLLVETDVNLRDTTKKVLFVLSMSGALHCMESWGRPPGIRRSRSKQWVSSIMRAVPKQNRCVILVFGSWSTLQICTTFSSPSLELLQKRPEAGSHLAWPRRLCWPGFSRTTQASYRFILAQHHRYTLHVALGALGSQQT